MSDFVFRFAPSPNGLLHLGHALSALLNADMAREAGGRLLLRIEDIDPTRCRPEYETAIYEDLAWLGIEWERPVRRQSEHFAEYCAALERLERDGLVYPAFESRAEIARLVTARAAETGKPWPRDPDGAPLYPGSAKDLPEQERARRRASEPFALRLDMARALARVGHALTWTETGEPEPYSARPHAALASAKRERPARLLERRRAGRSPGAKESLGARAGTFGSAGGRGFAGAASGDPGQKRVWTGAESGPGPRRVEARPELWGDVVLGRKETPASYYLAVVLDDALQGVTHVVRGLDLYESTTVHRLLQELLGLPAPVYHHHRLVLDADGNKLAKRDPATTLRDLRAAGWTATDVRRAVGL